MRISMRALAIAAGIAHVIVGGVPVFNNGALIAGVKPGKPVRAGDSN